jgi:enoyl-CoA hydratase/carnithine racemase
MVPGVAGTQTLPRAIGVGRALDLTLSGRTIDAREALRLGVVHRVVPPERLAATAHLLARRLAGLDPRVVVATRRALRAAFDVSLADGVALERRLGLGLERRGS